VWLPENILECQLHGAVILFGKPIPAELVRPLTINGTRDSLLFTKPVTGPPSKLVKTYWDTLYL